VDKLVQKMDECAYLMAAIRFRPAVPAIRPRFGHALNYRPSRSMFSVSVSTSTSAPESWSACHTIAASMALAG
jgi:hypothetical protein